MTSSSVKEAHPLPSPDSKSLSLPRTRHRSSSHEGRTREWTPDSGILERSLSDQGVQTVADFSSIKSSRSPTYRRRGFNPDPNNEKGHCSFRLDVPVRSAPTSVLSSPARSPQRFSTSDVSHSSFGIAQDFRGPAAVDVPIPHKPGSPSYMIPVRPSCSPNRSQLLSPTSGTACQTILSSVGVVFHSHHKSFPESSTGWPDGNTRSNPHPLPLPPGCQKLSPSGITHQIMERQDVPLVKSPWCKGKLIGRGTYGSVYEAFNCKTGAICAMKEVDVIPDDSKSAECFKQLEQEIKVLQHLKHPNIVEYKGCEMVDDHFCIYLEYVHPGSLNKYIKDHCGVVTESVVRNVSRHVLQGLSFLHSMKTIHRDIKGANLLVDASGVVKLADFGLAKHLTASVDLSLKGSPHWMAPEVLQGVMKKDSNVQHAYAVDIWSLGCTVIELFDGKPPWGDIIGAQAMFRVLHGSPPIPETLSEDGKDFLRRCFRRDPAERPSAASLLEHNFVQTSHESDASGSTQLVDAPPRDRTGNVLSPGSTSPRRWTWQLQSNGISSELESNLSKKGNVQEHSEYQMKEDSPQKSKVHEHSKHPLKDKHVQLEDPGFEVSPQRPKAHEHSKQVYTGFQDTAVGYFHPDEGSSTKFSGFHGKDDSIPSTSLEAGEEERVMEQELDLVETSSSKIYDDHTLDLSYKSITSLPKDISKYVAIRELKLKGCQLLMELGPEIGELVNLELLDLEGTEIICLPKEIAKLINLRSLKFSLYGYADQFQKSKRIGHIIPQKALSNLLKLNELSIDVTPDGNWWNAEVKTVIDDLHCLQELKTLCLYIPTIYLFGYLVQNIKLLIYQDHVCFRFTVGYHEERLTSRLPQEVLKKFHDLEKFEKGLKFTNGEEMPTEIKDALEHVDAFLLECHWSIKNLLEFGLKNTDKLKCCILVECNELQTLIDTKQHMDYDGAILGSLQHLSFHYMKSMQKIWRGPVRKGSLSNLKSLALYTCVSLTTVFKIDMLANLVNLEELRIEDCPKIKTLASSNYSDSTTARVFLPKLKSMLLLELPNLRCISSGPAIAPKLQRLVIFYCLKLRKLSKTEISSKDLKVLKGEKEWWDALKWYESDVSEADQNDLTNKFVPLKEDGDLEEQFLRD